MMLQGEKMDIDLATIITSIVTALVTASGTFLAIRRRVSRDGVEVAKDRAEANIIDHLERQRDKAVQEKTAIEISLKTCEAEKAAESAKVAKLTAEGIYTHSQIKILQGLVDRLGHNLDEEREELQKYTMENATLKGKIEVLEKNR